VSAPGDDVVSLFSDTETRPTPGMRAAMAAAEVGDEQKGEDPTTTRLQERVAALVGKQAALWLPTGTMCNLVAVKTHTRPGDALVAEAMAHVIRAESGGAALASGVMVQPIQTERGIFTPAELAAAMRRVAAVPVPYGQPVGVVCVEQTHNFGGGAVWPLEALDAVAACARAREVPVHMDGARLLNACAALGVPAAAVAARVDSLWIDFTKGLGAPIGAVLAGTAAFIAGARRYKQLFGGAMRQAGVAAAGCLLALDHHVERLAEDHEHARLLAQGLGAIDGIEVRTPTPETNMVFFDVSGLGLSNRQFVDRLAAAGVRVSGAGGQIRAVTHLDVSRQGIERALAAIGEIASAARD
jgi:threonine aldolase